MHFIKVVRVCTLHKFHSYKLNNIIMIYSLYNFYACYCAPFAHINCENFCVCVCAEGQCKCEQILIHKFPIIFTDFKWTFNNSAESIDVAASHVSRHGELIVIDTRLPLSLSSLSQSKSHSNIYKIKSIKCDSSPRVHRKFNCELHILANSMVVEEE